jgi:tetratricopeptide (TPR) repeat protein
MVEAEFGIALLRLNRYAEANNHFEPALRVLENRYGVDSPQLLLFLNGWIGALHAARKDEEAAQYERRVLKIVGPAPR